MLGLFGVPQDLSRCTPSLVVHDPRCVATKARAVYPSSWSRFSKRTSVDGVQVDGGEVVHWVHHGPS
jgi:hypothetical protein